MNKNYVFVVLIIILFFCGFAIWALFFKEAPTKPQTIEPLTEAQSEESPIKEKRFTLTGWILEIDKENNFLTVKSERDGTVIRGFIDEHTGMLRMDLPEELPEEKGPIDLIETEIGLTDFREGDYIYFVTRENLLDVAEFYGINRIRLYPFVSASEPETSIGAEESIKECKEYPGWNSSGKCYVESCWKASENRFEVEPKDWTASLAVCFYQIRNKTNNNYNGLENWQSFDCHGNFFTKKQIFLEIGPDGDCDTQGEKACQLLAIVVTQSDVQALGLRYYNIEF